MNILQQQIVHFRLERSREVAYASQFVGTSTARHIGIVDS